MHALVSLCGHTQQQSRPSASGTLLDIPAAYTAQHIEYLQQHHVVIHLPMHGRWSRRLLIFDLSS